MELHIVDAFAERPFAGNPAAVCLLDGPRPDAWMQSVAAEMNLSETAFLSAEGEAWRLRWFTPRVEVDLCGHATLASAHVLGRDHVRFLTRSGELSAERRGERIELDFPALPADAGPPPAGLLEALGVREARCAKSTFCWLVEVESEQTVRALAPDIAALAAVDVRSALVTARGRDHDFVSRFFAPGMGVDEDPVTGSAHCVLAPYWAARLGRDEMVGYQASARGGLVAVRVLGDRVRLGGRAVTVLVGELAV